jgi:hypothetical protein
MCNEHASVVVHPHNYNPNEENFEYVVWGTYECPGRLVTAVAAFLEESLQSETDNVYLTIFASTLSGPDGRSEGETIEDYLYCHLHELKAYAAIYPVFDCFSIDQIEELLFDRFCVIMDQDIPQPKNTVEDMQALSAYIKKYFDGKCQKLVLISSADHVPRVLRDALAAFKDQPEIAGNISMRPCLSCYGPPGEVVIFETPVSSKLSPEDWSKIVGMARDPDRRAKLQLFLSSN